jgi:hypothetical protein
LILATMPIRAAPYAHQKEAFDLAMRLFGLEGGDDRPISTGCAYLMEMG